ncbi:MAG: hypothetical protein K0R52_559 [Alphaproteobacteria bacterium]|jgi:hypothetical protein|nr:hypothetical protein [Alphaproteobacteria bacterium]
MGALKMEFETRKESLLHVNLLFSEKNTII